MNRFILTLLPFLLPTYLIRFKIGPFPTTVLEISLLVFLALWIFDRKKNGWRDAFRLIKQRGWLWPLTLWLIAGVIGIFVARNQMAALGLWRAYFLEPLLVFIMLTDLVKDNFEKKILLRNSIFVLTLLTAWAIAQYVTGYGIPSPWNTPPAGIRATGPFPFPNALALFAVPITALCAYLALNHRKDIIKPVLAWFGFLIGLLATLLSKSDGGLIAILGAFVISFIIKKKTHWHVLALWIITIAVFIAVPPIKKDITDKILFREWSGKVRLVMWKETSNMLVDHPLTGVGLGGYPTGIKPYHKATWMEIFQYPHNVLLNLWSEVGLLGTAAFAWILALWLKHGRLLALPVVAAILIQGLVDVPYFKNDLAVMFWMLVVLTSFTEQNSESRRR